MKHNGRIAYETICAAKGGDTAALDEILRHYERYILHFCRRVFDDEYGILRAVVDESRRSQTAGAPGYPLRGWSERHSCRKAAMAGLRARRHIWG